MSSRRALLGALLVIGALLAPAQARGALPVLDWTQERLAEEAATRQDTHRAVALSLGAAGVASAGVATFFGVQALQARASLLTLPAIDVTGRTGLIAQGEGFRLLANVLFAVAAALATAGVLVWLF
jgi:hypothetical protein